MTQIKEKLIVSLTPLPGGSKRYLITLHEMLEWVSQKPNAHRLTFTEWAMSNYKTGRGSVGGYLQTLRKLKTLQVYRDGSLVLTSIGKQFLEVSGDTKARIVLEQIFPRYIGIQETLQVFTEKRQATHLNDVVHILQPKFPRWHSDVLFEERLQWLTSLGCLRQLGKQRCYEVTELGEMFYERLVPKPVQIYTSLEDAVFVPPTSKHLQIIENLVEFSTDGTCAKQFESTVAEAFQFLGFSVHQFGEPGKTDILAHAQLGTESYRVIIDTKSRRDGKLDYIDTRTLHRHQQLHDANYVVVVAYNFTGDKLIENSQEGKIILLSVPLLSQLLLLHHKTPLNLQEYRSIFMIPGVTVEIPSSIRLAVNQRERWSRLLHDLIFLVYEAYERNLGLTWSIERLHTMLVVRSHDMKYSEQEIQAAVFLLTHPAIRAASFSKNTGIIFAMNTSTFNSTLHRLADLCQIYSS